MLANETLHQQGPAQRVVVLKSFGDPVAARRLGLVVRSGARRRSDRALRAVPRRAREQLRRQ